jgi:hypothetical protein
LVRLWKRIDNPKGRPVRPPIMQNGAQRIDPFARFQGIRICASSHSLSSGEVLPSFNTLAGIDFESLLLDTNGRFGRPT